MSKYFTPSEEDLRIGYEFQYNANKEDSWKDGVIKRESELSFLFRLLDKNKLRTSYLTKEQIIAEGWKIEDSIGDANLFNLGDINLVYSTKSKALNIFIVYQEDESIFDKYNGDCKDINTFRQIIKLLGICT